MRKHSEIVAAAGKPEEVALRRGVSVHTVRSWAQRDSIPAEHWAGFAADRIATLEELAVAAAAKRTTTELAKVSDPAPNADQSTQAAAA